MAKELINEIKNIVEANGLDCRLLDQSTANAIVEKLAGRFNYDLSFRWLWDTVHAGKSVNYGNDYSLWETQLSLLLQNFEKRIYLAITDDEFYPWPVFDFKKDLLVEILKEQHPFEYFVFDESMKNVLFDNHHSSLILVASQ